MSSQLAEVLNTLTILPIYKFDFSASWVDVSRRVTSKLLYIYTHDYLYYESVSHVEHFGVELDTLHQHMT